MRRNSNRAALRSMAEMDGTAVSSTVQVTQYYLTYSSSISHHLFLINITSPVPHQS